MKGKTNLLSTCSSEGKVSLNLLTLNKYLTIINRLTLIMKVYFAGFENMKTTRKSKNNFAKVKQQIYGVLENVSVFSNKQYLNRISKLLLIHNMVSIFIYGKD